MKTQNNKFIGQSNKESALSFLRLVTGGQIDEAYEKYVSPNFSHHNPYFKGDAKSLKDGMKENEAKFSNKNLEVKHILEEGNLVAVHSHVQLVSEEMEFATVHIYRFENDKIVDMWDIAQQIPKDAVNNMF